MKHPGIKKLYRTLENYGKEAVRSVAFLPVPMIFTAVVFGYVFFWLENNTNVSDLTGEWLPALAITSQDTARTILGMFVGGLITLTVFTFSQIMILLNQVASSYSPRLLPKLTGDRSLQFVMGLNLATIVLTITVLLSIRSNEGYSIPNFSILVCVFFGVVCLCLFVYFVTAITKKIQVDSIIDASARDAMESLESQCKLGDRGYSEQGVPEDVAEWFVIPSPISGYVGSVDHDTLAKLAQENATRFYIGVSKGQYVPKGLPLLQSQHVLDDEKVEDVLSAVEPIRDQFDDWYLPNLKQLTEIALKALSPGINDPGTALMVIDRQTEVLGKMMHVPLYNYYRCEEGGEIWFSRHSYEEVLRTLMSEMRCYAKEDPLVVRRLFQMLYHLLEMAAASLSYRLFVQREIAALLRDARRHIENPHDRSQIARDIFGHRRAIKHASRLLQKKNIYEVEPEPATEAD
ncbi:putative membrane protein [Neolewinella xylanilytica]|uniref:Putative membrane protein n=1 Tax=Neolewinella xylanilytica TaxID=1514080 RepID=A0A2S6I3N1_9BACT|nr:DUF2254 domain-containing protein [Neolewinella xylanilytica]PPK85775.1 putative membrane protein [Neolewinella xylanilytica]